VLEFKDFRKGEKPTIKNLKRKIGKKVVFAVFENNPYFFYLPNVLLEKIIKKSAAQIRRYKDEFLEILYEKNMDQEFFKKAESQLYEKAATLLFGASSDLNEQDQLIKEYFEKVWTERSKNPSRRRGKEGENEK